MKIAHYTYKNKEHYGIIDQQTLVSLPDLAKQFSAEFPKTIEEFIAKGETALKTAESLLSRVQDSNLENISVPLSKVTLQAPIVFPPKIICLGWNYRDHVSETSRPIPKEPVIFMKPHTAIAGPNTDIVKPRFVRELDYEGELAIVIGKKAKNIPVQEAKNYIFGYTILNDVSAREIQFGDIQWTRGKSFDTFAPTGPCITTKNQLPDTSNLRIHTWINGELRQNGTTKTMIFNVDEVVHHLSRVMTLEPCDIIATGTPSGVGFAMKPPRFLKHGDTVRIEIEGIGVLENVVKEQ